jgi:hypothetical protein
VFESRIYITKLTMHKECNRERRKHNYLWVLSFQSGVFSPKCPVKKRSCDI